MTTAICLLWVAGCLLVTAYGLYIIEAFQRWGDE